MAVIVGLAVDVLLEAFDFVDGLLEVEDGLLVVVDGLLVIVDDLLEVIGDEDVVPVPVPETVTVAVLPSKALATKVPFTPAVMGTRVEVVPL